MGFRTAHKWVNQQYLESQLHPRVSPWLHPKQPGSLYRASQLPKEVLGISKSLLEQSKAEVTKPVSEQGQNEAQRSRVVYAWV